jgi:hypothetical protein
LTEKAVGQENLRELYIQGTKSLLNRFHAADRRVSERYEQEHFHNRRSIDLLDRPTPEKPPDTNT